MPPTFSGKMGQLLVNEVLPEDLRNGKILDSKGLTDLLRDVAERYPDKYRDISHKLNLLGEDAAQQLGGYSFGLHAMRRSNSANVIRDRIRGQVQSLLDDDGIPDDLREAKIIKLLGQAQSEQESAVYDESLKEENPIALQIKSGARGKKMALNSLRGSDLLYVDHRDRPVPIPVLRSYSEGLSPAEYWAAAYGARHGIVSVKLGTASSGFLAKQLNQATHRLLVTHEDDAPVDTVRGLPVSVDDNDSVGALLAHPAGSYGRNTVITPKVLKALHDGGIERILVRSPTVGGAPDGGLYSRDVGVRETGDLPPKGTFSGLQAGQAISEPLSQATLSAKHAGGVAGASKSVSGFAWINALIQIPKVFPGGATHAQADGRVQQILKAPGGGLHVQVNGVEHYVPQGLELLVKPGDEVEAGDVLSEGIPSPAEIVKHKGIGEGRLYFTNALRKALTDSGVRNNRRNIELISRGLINHVELDDEIGEYAPDDVVPFDTLEHDYKPREGSSVVPIKSAVGQYLEKPYLHHTIGTKVKPSMLADLKHFGVTEVHVHKDPPPFHPLMVRGMYNLQHDPDALTRNLGSGLQASFLDSVHRGGKSDEKGTSYVPSLARTVDFGRTGVIRPPVVTPQKSLMKMAAGSPIAPIAPQAPAPIKPLAPQQPQMQPAIKPVAPPPSPALHAGEIGGFGDFFNHFGNLLRGPGYDAGMAPASANFQSTVAPKQFGLGMTAAGMPPAPAPIAPQQPGVWDQVKPVLPGMAAHTAVQQAGQSAAKRMLVRAIPRLGVGTAAKMLPFGIGAAVAEPLGWTGKKLGIPGFEDDMSYDTNAFRQEAEGLHYGMPQGWRQDTNRPWWVRAGDWLANDAGTAYLNPQTAVMNSFDKSSEDAKGIPSRNEIGDLSKLEAGKLYDLFTQLHNATKAGPHTDLRIGDKEQGLYSWAVPKGLPEPGKKHLAVRQPQHSHEYGSWSGTIPEGEYGAGTVKSQINGQALVTESGPEKLHFTTAHEKYPKRFTVVAPKAFGENNHLLINSTPTEPLPYQKIRYKKVAPEQVEEKLQNLEPGSSAQPKIDGASSLVQLLKNQLELYSYRASKPTGHPIVHTEKVLHGRPRLHIPDEYQHSILRGELHGVKTDAEGKETVIHPSELGGILNATLANSLAKQQAGDVRLRSALFDVQQVGNKPIDFKETPYTDRREHLKSILPSLPQDIFHLTPEATTPEDAVKLWHETASGTHPLTDEGIVVHPPTGKPWKAKHIEDHDVYIRSIFPGEGRLAGTHAGGFEYSAEPDGPVLGRIGTGFSDDVRQALHERPDDFIGRVARVKSQEKLQSGALRAPAYIALHEDYPAAPVRQKAAELDRVRKRVQELQEKRATNQPLAAARERLLAIRAKNLGL